MFHVGQKVVCIKTHGENVTTKDTEYMVSGVKSCVCGDLHLDVGVMLPKESKATRCKCGNRDLSRTWWQDSLRFVPLSDWQEAEEAVKELLRLERLRKNLEEIKKVTNI